MPYGMPQSAGGDSAATDSKMERCVAQVVAQGHDKVSAIRICKVAIIRASQGGNR